ncbi:MAG: extracellular solute-binding protein [Chloroflexi bacterium]|nr:extracellular solute-binding protein [Chloroflexota bacterium]
MDARVKGFGLALATALLVLACAPAPSAAPAASGAKPAAAAQSPEQLWAAANALPAAERQAKLVAEATREGKLIWYTTGDVTAIERRKEAFQKKYPGIKAEHFKADVAEVLQRLLTEHRAGTTFADVFEAPSLEALSAQQGGALGRYPSPERAAFGPEFLDADGYWSLFRQELEVVGYNTNLAKKDGVPTSLEGLVDPALKGKLGRTALGARWVQGVFQVMGEEQGRAYLQKLAANQPRIYASNTALASALSSGEVAIAFDVHLEQVRASKQKGAPVDVVVPDPIFLQVGAIAATKNAPHPHAAALFVDFILSEEGQMLVANMQNPTRKGLEFPDSPLLKGIKKIVTYSPDLVGKGGTEAQKLFEQLFVR